MITKVFTPSYMDSSKSTFLSEDSDNPFSNAYGKDTNNTTFAKWYANTGSNTFTRIYYKFDCTSIPKNAIINSVSCKAKCRLSTDNVTYLSSTVYIGSGDSDIGSGAGYPAFGATETVVNVSTDSWTREQLQDAYIKINAIRGWFNASTSQYVEFYGAELTVEYTLPEGLYIKKDGQYQYVNSVYKKINGVYVAQDNIETLFDENIKYIRAD